MTTRHLEPAVTSPAPGTVMGAVTTPRPPGSSSAWPAAGAWGQARHGCVGRLLSMVITTGSPSLPGRVLYSTRTVSW
jgi:hypothetical protein